MPVGVGRIVLHIGTEKTGTSSIQHFLSKNRAALADEGFVYPSFTGANGGSQWGLVAAVQKQSWKSEIGARLGIKDKMGAQAYRQRLLDSIDAELLACPNRHTLILSSEHLHSRLRHPAVLHELKSLLERWSSNIQVVVYFRRQDRVAISLYSTRLKSGQADPDVFSAIKNGALPYYYDYESIYTNWSQVFGKKAMQAGIFAPQHLAGGDLLTDFFERIGIAEAGKPRPAKINQSLNEVGVQLLLEVNRQWPKKRLGGPNPSRELLVANIARENPGHCCPATQAQARAFYAYFAAGNARLANIAFAELKEPLFDEDFNDYPDVLAAPTNDVSQEVRSRIRAWRAASVATQKLGVGRLLLIARRCLGTAMAQVPLLTDHIKRRRVLRTDSGLPPFFLHVGLPKTATTTLQEVFFSQHPSICYLRSNQGEEAERFCASSEIYHALRPIFWQRTEPTDPALVRSVLREFAVAQGADKPLLGSWEALLIKPPKEFRAMLREAQAVLGDVRIIATLRNPLKRIPSAYLQALNACVQYGGHYTLPKGRVFISFDEWLMGADRLSAAHDPRFDFYQNLRFAVKFLGRDKVGVFLMEDMVEDRDAFFTSIQNFMGVAPISVERIEDKHLNKAFTNAEIELLKTIETSTDKRAQWLALEYQERYRQMEIAAKAAGSDKCTVVLSDAQRELIAARSRELNLWLVDTFDLDLARHGYPL